MAYIGAVPTSATFAIDTFNGDGSTVTFTLREAPLATSSILVFVGGVRQNTDTYSLSGSSLIFSEAPPSGTGNIQVLFLGLNASPSIPSDGSVTANKILDGAITGAKLAASSITGDKIGLTSINANNIVNGTITGAKIASGTITGDDIAVNQITGNLLTASCVSGNNIAVGQITGNLLTANCVTGNNILSLGTPTSGTLANCTVDGTNSVGFRNIPNSGAKTTSYTLVAGDVGKFIELGTGGSVVVPASVFAAGDVVSIFNNTSGSISCTCSAVTDFYKGGTDADISSFSVTTRGVVTILFITATRAVVTGNLA